MIYVYIASTVSPVALLGLHEIVGWCSLFFFFFNISTVCKVLALFPPPPLFSRCQGVIDFD